MPKMSKCVAAMLQHNEDTIVTLEDRLRTIEKRLASTETAYITAKDTLDLALKERASYHAALAMHERYLVLLERLILHVG